MNKKIIALIIVIIVIVLGIGIWFISFNNPEEPTNNNSSTNTTENGNSNQTQEENNNDNDNDNGTTNVKKIAIIYFSATGTTERVARFLRDWVGGDLIEIVPKDEYTSEDLNYNNSNSRSTKEQNDFSARPEIKNTINTDNYDVIFLGYPIWWGDVPKIILTFLDSHNLDGKIVIPFCTSGSTGIENSMNTLKNYNKNIKWIDGKRLSTSESETKNWVNGLDY